ncbi:MAG: prenyltransferase/squalene oxidase repeat-containing protein [Phycisphaerae bacterium]
MLTIRQQMLRWAGLARNRLPEGPDPVARFLLSGHTDSGGFAGRDGNADLYYTSFAIDALRALGRDDTPSGLVDYLDRAVAGIDKLDLVHLCCLIRCRVALRLPCGRGFVKRLSDFRSRDGGFATATSAANGTSYGAFLALGAWQELDAPPLPNIDALAGSLLALRRPDGSFANDTQLPVPSVPATAAAVVALNRLNHPAGRESTDWLLDRRLSDGGFEPVAGLGRCDLLSTATAMIALAFESSLPTDNAETTVGFVHSLYRDGGFAGSADDPRADCEYTWYALAALGLSGGSEA